MRAKVLRLQLQCSCGHVFECDYETMFMSWFTCTYVYTCPKCGDKQEVDIYRD